MPVETQVDPKTGVVTKYDVSRSGKRTKIETFNVWISAPESEWQYVSIPAEDIHGYPHPPLEINDDKFDAGKTHFVPPILAAEMQRILKSFEVEQIALLQPRKRKRALEQLAKEGGQSVPGATPGVVPGLQDIKG